MMNCNEVTRSASAFLEHKLRLRKRLAFLMHIMMCRGCRAYVEQLKLTILGLRSLERAPSTSPEPPESLLGQFRDHSHRDHA